MWLCRLYIYICIYPTGLFYSFLLLHHFPDPLFFQPSLDSWLVCFFLCCLGNLSLFHWWEQAIPYDSVYQTAGQCWCLPNFRVVVWAVCCIWKKTYLRVELYCLPSNTQHPAGLPETKQAKGVLLFSAVTNSFLFFPEGEVALCQQPLLTQSDLILLYFVYLRMCII